MDDAPEASRGARRREVALVFLKLGTIGFGGPAAHVALMRRECVRRRRWLSEDRFLELFGASNMIPGPSSTELGMMLGYLRAGWTGLLLAGACFIGPAVVIVLALAWAYVRFGSLPQTGWALYGVKPVILAIILDALWSLGRRALTSWPLLLLAVTVVTLYLIGISAFALLLGGAAIVMLGRNAPRLAHRWSAIIPMPVLGAVAASSSPSIERVFLAFLKIGAVVYGSGYVLLAFLRSDLVEHQHWLSQTQLLDAVAVGQVTPGPVFTTATFIGYLLLGVPGALVATAGIFLPAFVLAGAVFSWLPRLRRSPWATALIDGATVCGLGLMAGVTLQLGQASLVDWFTVVLGVFAFLVLRRFEPNAAWLVLAAAVVGWIARGLGV